MGRFIWALVGALLAAWLLPVEARREFCFETDLDQEETQDIKNIEWWKKTNFYHIYLRSFYDSDGDGNGDLEGVIQKLDHFKELGVETLLMSPFYKSPMKDGGYDIIDHKMIDERFGDESTLNRFFEELKKKQLRVVLDFVPNHTSNKHPWFQCSEEALIKPECSKYKNYYVWRGHDKEKPPSNWVSVFNGSAWQWSDKRKQFYLHSFLVEQPDLNLRNEMVRAELKEIAKYWLDKGADGLRVDAVPFLLEDTYDTPNEPVNPSWKPPQKDYDRLRHTQTFSFPGTPEVVRDWREIAKEYGTDSDKSKVIINEAYDANDRLVNYHGSSPEDRYADMVFAPGFIFMQSCSVQQYEYYVVRWYDDTRKLCWPNEGGAISPWIAWLLAQHDLDRSVVRLGERNIDGYFWLGFIMPGSPIFYYGDEIGTHHVEASDIPKRTLEEGEATRLLQRAPMAWSKEAQGGFSKNDSTWLPLPRNYETHNVETMKNSEGKNHYKNFKSIIELRHKHLELITFGETHFLKSDSGVESNIFAVLRSHEKFHNILVLVNCGDKEEKLQILEAEKVTLPKKAKILLTNNDNFNDGQDLELENLVLPPNQALVLYYEVQ